MIGTGPMAPFAGELAKFARENPNAAAFLPRRYIGRIVNLGFSPHSFTFYNFQLNCPNGLLPLRISSFGAFVSVFGLLMLNSSAK